MNELFLRIISVLVIYKNIIIFGLISLVLAVFARFFLTLEFFFERVNYILVVVDNFKFLAAVAYIFCYGLIVTFSIPVASVLTIVSGYIFGGVFIWEYYDQPKNWLTKMNKIINNEYLPIYMKLKCNLF